MSPLSTSSAGNSGPSVARTNFALARAVSGLAFSAASASGAAAAPSGATLMWMSLRGGPPDIGPIRSAGAEPLDGGLLVSERFQEAEGKLARIEGLCGEGGNSLFNLYGIHRSFPIHLDHRGSQSDNCKIARAKDCGSRSRISVTPNEAESLFGRSRRGWRAFGKGGAALRDRGDSRAGRIFVRPPVRTRLPPSNGFPVVKRDEMRGR